MHDKYVIGSISDEQSVKSNEKALEDINTAKNLHLAVNRINSAVCVTKSKDQILHANNRNDFYDITLRGLKKKTLAEAHVASSIESKEKSMFTMGHSNEANQHRQ